MAQSRSLSVEAIMTVLQAIALATRDGDIARANSITLGQSAIKGMAWSMETCRFAT
jgi:hypothetical protein